MKTIKNNTNNIFKISIRDYRTSNKQNLTLSPELEEIIIGLMLGDLYAEN